jgi:hypothetical protein
MNNYEPYTDINIPDFKIEKRDMGRVHVDDIVWPKKEEKIELELPEPEPELLETEEIPNEESSFTGGNIWGDNVHYEVENSLTRVLIVVLVAVAIYYAIKSIFKKKKD